MAVSRDSPRGARLAFWATGGAVFTLWNAATLVGALGARMLDDPRVFGLDAAVSGAFLALVAPRLREPGAPAVVAVAVGVSVVTIPVLPVGFPVLVAAAAVFALTHLRARAQRRGAALAVRARAPFLVVVGLSAAVTAGLRLVG